MEIKAGFSDIFQSSHLFPIGIMNFNAIGKEDGKSPDLFKLLRDGQTIKKQIAFLIMFYNLNGLLQ